MKISSIFHPFIFFVINQKLKCYTKSSLAVNILNHFGLTYYAFIVYKSIQHENDHHSDKKAVICGEWLLSYMVYDLLVMWMLTKTRNLVYTTHHVAAIALIQWMLNTGRYHYYFPVICMFEVSSIPLNLRYLLRQYDVPKTAPIMVMNDLMFALTFIGVRIVFGGRHVVNVLKNIDSDEDSFLKVILATFGSLHIYWLSGMIFKLIKSKTKNVKSTSDLRKSN